MACNYWTLKRKKTKTGEIISIVGNCEGKQNLTGVRVHFTVCVCVQLEKKINNIINA